MSEVLYRVIIAKLTRLKQLLIALLKGYLSILCLIHAFCEVNECGLKALLDQVRCTLSSKSFVIITSFGSEKELRNFVCDTLWRMPAGCKSARSPSTRILLAASNIRQNKIESVH